MQYKAIVFDYGGVLVVNNLFKGGNLLELIAAELTVPADDFRAEYFKHNYIHNVENLPWIEACLAAVRVFDDSKEIEEKVRQMNADFTNAKALNTELLELVPKLRESGYVTAILSNYTSALKGVLKEHEIDGLFDHTFVSGEIGFQKPDPRIFAHVCDELQITPEEMVFIDDTPRSLETAGEVGYVPILYKDNDQLFAEFDQLGVNV